MKRSRPLQSLPPAKRMGAVVIARYSRGDNDYIVTFLTREQGLITALAKNARQSIKRFGGNLLSPGTAAWYYIKQKPNSDLAFVERGEINPRSPRLSSDPICRTLVAWALELLRAFEAHHNPATNSFNLLLRHFGALAAIADFTSPALEGRRLSLGFTKCYLELAGFAAILDRCCLCRQTVSDIWYADTSNGDLICQQCAKILKRQLYRFPDGLREALLSVTEHSKCPSLNNQMLQSAESFFQHLASIQAGRAFKSPRVLLEVLKPIPSHVERAGATEVTQNSQSCHASGNPSAEGN